MPDIQTKIESNSPDEFAIVIDGTRLTQFLNETLVLTVDNVGGGFSFETPFFPDTKEYRELFRPFGYQSAQIYIGGNLILNGTVELISPQLSESSNFLNVQGRSKTGVIVDCTFEKADFGGGEFLANGLEFQSQSLESISKAIVKKFGIGVSFPDGAGAIFETVSPQGATETIFDFLQNLARQRSLLIGQDNLGNLLFRKTKTKGAPIAELSEGHQGILLSQAEYDGTKRFSRYNVFGQSPDITDNFALVEDKTIPILRPKSISANDTNSGNINQSADWALSSDISKSISIPVSYEGWLTPDGELWRDNEFITVTAPSLMIYKPSTLLIKRVTFKGQNDKKITELELTLPEAYNNSEIEDEPWS